mmetsp:Transcript_72049/g.156414  ORF Transcript_72049/g.156414 Transcript_72049/m.156414 type:complete len:302 (+) Transcript_72049:63-968(+)
MGFAQMAAPRGLPLLPLCGNEVFPCPTFEQGTPEEGPIFARSSLSEMSTDGLSGNSDSDSSAQTSELREEAGTHGLQTVANAFCMMPQTAEIGLGVEDFAPLNPWDDFCDSPRERLLAKLNGDIGEETQTKPKRRRRRRLGATLKEVTPGTPDSQRALVQERSVDPEAPAWLETDTTVMLRNIPNRYTVEEIVAELKAKNFEGLFDFIYLPIDFQLKKNKGYAFINFNCPRTRTRFVSVFDRCALTRYATRKILRVDPAVNQGFEENMAKYSTKDAARITNEWFRPMIFPCTKDSVAEGLQ